MAESSNGAEVETRLVRAWLDQARLVLARTWRADGRAAPPARTDLLPLQSISLPRNWRFLSQRQGAVALIDQGQLAVPIVEQQLAWICAGANVFEGVQFLIVAWRTRSVRVADPRALADALGLDSPELVMRLRNATRPTRLPSLTRGARRSLWSQSERGRSRRAGTGGRNCPRMAPLCLRRPRPRWWQATTAGRGVASRGGSGLRGAGDAPCQARVLDRPRVSMREIQRRIQRWRRAGCCAAASPGRG